MFRPSKITIEPSALLHNLAQIKRYAPGKKVVAMVKANAYGCGLSAVVPVLEGQVDAFGVACLEEALTIRALGARTECILFQGVFSQEEWSIISAEQFSCVIHHHEQIKWLLSASLSKPIKLWIKVNTGMNRLGFDPAELPEVEVLLRRCSMVEQNIGLMTHMACADQPEREENNRQIGLFKGVDSHAFNQRSMANSAAIIAFPDAHFDVVRAGIMLYGVSPFVDRNANALGLIPVMRFKSVITAIHHYPAHIAVGYGGTWASDKPSLIGVVAVGYGDGYPRHIEVNTTVWVNGREAPIVGRISMDMLTIDLTAHPDVAVGASVELWGTHILVERVAKSAGTIGYELLCQVTDRVRNENGC